MRASIVYLLVALCVESVFGKQVCGKRDVVDAGKFLGIPPDCTEVDLYKTGLDDAAVIAMASVLSGHQNLKWISLSENKISEEGAAALATALESNSVLTALKLWDQKTPKGKDKISKKTLKAINSKLKKNKSNPYTKEEEAKISEARQDDIVPDKLVKHVFSEGEGDFPGDGAAIKAHYTGTLANGEKFDSSRDRGTPFDFTLGQGQVIGCWDKGFATMKKGEKALLTCTSEFGYGDQGSPPTIPGGATLKFDVELIDFTGPSKSAHTEL